MNARSTVKAITKTSVLIFWTSALALGQETVAKRCHEFVVARTSSVLRYASNQNVSEAVVRAILSSDRLSCKELQLFKFLNKWIKYNKPSTETITSLVSLIRVPMIKKEDIETVVLPSGIVPSGVIKEALEYQKDSATIPEHNYKERAEVRLLTVFFSQISLSFLGMKLCLVGRFP